MFGLLLVVMGAAVALQLWRLRRARRRGRGDPAPSQLRTDRGVGRGGF
jgi:hypothetical protein